MLQTLYAWLGASGKGSELALKLNALHETLMCSLTFSSAVAASGAKALSQAASHASSLTAGAPCCMSSSSLSRSIASMMSLLQDQSLLMDCPIFAATHTHSPQLVEQPSVQARHAKSQSCCTVWQKQALPGWTATWTYATITTAERLANN